MGLPRRDPGKLVPDSLDDHAVVGMLCACTAPLSQRCLTLEPLVEAHGCGSEVGTASAIWAARCRELAAISTAVVDASIRDSLLAPQVALLQCRHSPHRSER
jgi:hypothetical protein